MGNNSNSYRACVMVHFAHCLKYYSSLYYLLSIQLETSCCTADSKKEYRMNFQWNNLLRVISLALLVIACDANVPFVLHARPIRTQSQLISTYQVLLFDFEPVLALTEPPQDKSRGVKGNTNVKNNTSTDTTKKDNSPLSLDFTRIEKIPIWSDHKVYDLSVLMQVSVWYDPKTGQYHYLYPNSHKCDGPLCHGPVIHFSGTGIRMSMDEWSVNNISSDDKNPIFVMDGVVDFTPFHFKKQVHARVEYNAVTRHYKVTTSRGTTEGTGTLKY